jgi:hypothetical protein
MDHACIALVAAPVLSSLPLALPSPSLCPTQEKGLWKRFEMVEGKEKGSIMLEPTQDQLDMNDMFATVQFYSRKQSVIAASSGGGGNDTQNVNGIVQVRVCGYETVCGLLWVLVRV